MTKKRYSFRWNFVVWVNQISSTRGKGEVLAKETIEVRVLLTNRLCSFCCHSGRRAVAIDCFNFNTENDSRSAMIWYAYENGS